MIDINKFIFTRTGADKKKATVEALSEDELLRVSTDTLVRIVKEVGKGTTKVRNHNKWLNIPNDLKVGNHWNSTVDQISLYKKVLWIDFYVQYGDHDTDGTFTEPWESFSGRNIFQGEIEGEDWHGNPKYYYYKYDRSDKAEVIRSFLLTYIRKKYAQINSES